MSLLISDMWRGALVGRTIRVHFERTARTAIPPDRPGRVAWLDDAWAGADAWVAAHVALPRPDRARRRAGSDVVRSVPG